MNSKDICWSNLSKGYWRHLKTRALGLTEIIRGNRTLIRKGRQ